LVVLLGAICHHAHQGRLGLKGKQNKSGVNLAKSQHSGKDVGMWALFDLMYFCLFWFISFGGVSQQGEKNVHAKNLDE
jgi:hypothetical protein